MLDPLAGLPKAVVVPHRSLVSNILQFTSSATPRTVTTAGDTALGTIPLSHMYGLLTLVHAYPLLGITSVLFSSGLPPFAEFLDTVEKLQIDHFLLVPPLVNAFIKHHAAQGRTFPFAKSCLVAAAPLDVARERAFKAIMPLSLAFGQVYGLTETCEILQLPPCRENLTEDGLIRSLFDHWPPRRRRAGARLRRSPPPLYGRQDRELAGRVR